MTAEKAPAETPEAPTPRAPAPGAPTPRAQAPGIREPIWARPETRRRSTLSRETIVRAAIDLADREGLGAVSIRRVAAELGARAMSLYTYLDTKDELFHLMADAATQEVLLPEPLDGDWREILTEISRRTRAAVMQHRWVVDLPAGGRMGGPNALRHVEQSLRAVAGLGLPPERQWLVLVAVDDYVLGYVTREVSQGALHDGWDEQRAEILGLPYYQQLLASGEFPLLKTFLEVGQAEDDAFELGLRWLLDGIAADLGLEVYGAD